jgi:hypothetical protein
LPFSGPVSSRRREAATHGVHYGQPRPHLPTGGFLRRVSQPRRRSLTGASEKPRRRDPQSALLGHSMKERATGPSRDAGKRIIEIRTVRIIPR